MSGFCVAPLGLAFHMSRAIDEPMAFEILPIAALKGRQKRTCVTNNQVYQVCWED